MRSSLRALTFLLVGSLFVLYLVVGYAWVTETRALSEGDLLFHADTTRVVENETSIEHVHGRTVLHPLHVALTIPLGVPLTRLTGSPQLVALFITAAFAAACVYNLELLLRRCTSLPGLDRALFVAILAFSAGHFTFASVPETHGISAFFLSLTALQLAKSGGASEPFPAAAPSRWLHLFRASHLLPLLLAAGALLTNVFLAPLLVLLRLSPREPRFRRWLSALALSGALVVLLGALHFAQRAAFYRSAAGPPARPDTSQVVTNQQPHAMPPVREVEAEKPRRTGVIGWFLERFEHELEYVSWRPLRPVEVGLGTLVFNLYPPRVEGYRIPTSDTPAVRLDYWKFDFRFPGAIGSILWAGLLVVILGAWIKTGALRRLGQEPVVVFALGWLALYFGIFNLYHVYPVAFSSNDVFLFAPNLVLPWLFIVGVAYDRGPLSADARARRLIRVGLCLALVMMLVNTSLHVTSLMQMYERA